MTKAQVKKLAKGSKGDFFEGNYEGAAQALGLIREWAAALADGSTVEQGGDGSVLLLGIDDSGNRTSEELSA